MSMLGHGSKVSQQTFTHDHFLGMFLRRTCGIAFSQTYFRQSSANFPKPCQQHPWGIASVQLVAGTSLLVAGTATTCIVCADQTRSLVSPADMTGKSTRLTFVLFGDSITGWGFGSGGWGQRLAGAYMCKADVLNRGYAGYNTRFALLGIKRLLRRVDVKDAGELAMNEHLARASLWTVMLGTNDSGFPDGGFSVVHVPLLEYERNLAAIVRSIQSIAKDQGHQEAKIIVLTPATVDDAQVNTNGKASHSNVNTGLYAAAARRVATDGQVVLCDVYAKMQSRGQPSDFVSDGLHLNACGNELVYELVKKTIEEQFPEMASANCRLELPGVQYLWGDQDYHSVFARY